MTPPLSDEAFAETLRTIAAISDGIETLQRRHAEAVQLLRGLCGLVELVEHRGDLPANLRMRENHRYVCRRVAGAAIRDAIAGGLMPIHVFPPARTYSGQYEVWSDCEPDSEADGRIVGLGDTFNDAKASAIAELRTELAAVEALTPQSVDQRADPVRSTWTPVASESKA